ncbi:antitoxin MazE family protein [Tepidimonas taiwanensis]|nr:antitoxin MazE family protein [Tepidimonas taiwanensis]MCX7693328.1 antitoxin MazE family protein [Tepidimonas taiwanensis]MDM7463510.1 antitoxin MazE family protein [Tepidimonas taiwanensis]
MQRHRAKLRSQGMRVVQLWVPDTRRADFTAECRQQSALPRVPIGA